MSLFLLAQALATPPPEAAVQAPAVIVYRADFFAAARPYNVFEMLQRVPGFSLETGENVRGYEGAAGNVLIDGKRPVTKTETLEDILRRMPASQIERIELIRGGAPGIDMQGKSVLANVVRKGGDGWRGLLAVADTAIYDGRHRPAIRLEGSGESGGKSWEASLLAATAVDDGAGEGSRLRVDPASRPPLLGRVESDGEIEQLNLTGAYQLPLTGGTLRINGRVFKEAYDYDETISFSLPGPGLEIAHDGKDENETELGARYSRELGARGEIEIVALNNTDDERITSDFTGGTVRQAFLLDTKAHETIGRVVGKYRQSETLSWELGGEGAFNAQRARTRLTEDGADAPLPAANVKVEETRGELFIRATWRATPAWTIEGSFRQEGSRIASEGDVEVEKTLYFTKPRLAATLSVDPQTQVRLRFERVVGQLDFEDFAASGSLNNGVVTAGNPDLHPEQAWVSEAALERRFLGNAAVVLTLRRSELSDVIDRKPFGAFDAPGNIGKGRKDEVSVSLTLPFDRLGLKGAQLKGEATKRWSRVTDPTTGARREISDLKPLEWEAHFTHDLPHWRANWGVDVFGATRETAYRSDQVESIKLKTFVVPFVEWKPRPDLAFRAEIQNVTNRGLRRTRDQYAGPRGTAPLAYIDDRDNQFGRIFYLRVRKSFGG